MEEYTTEEQGTKSAEIKRWLQDNLRIIISIAIVVAIAGGIYSYSKRTDAPAVTDESISTEKTTDESEADKATATDENKATDEKAAPSKTATATPAPASKETETGFVETAARGEGSTHLARRALANYLEKNPDSALTKEHKIYIEDFLRKQKPSQKVATGTTIEFSKDSVQKAIAASKNLNERQLKNLQKYSARVSTL